MKYILAIVLLLTSWARADTGAYALYSYDSASYMVRFNYTEVRSIASITKLFTANAVIRSGVDLQERIKVNGRSSGHVPQGVLLTRYDLLKAMIISSDNRAAETLANHHPGGFNQFIRDVNAYNQANALYDTQIVDSTGLLPGNTSTIRDLVEFLYQIRNNPVIRDIADERTDSVPVPRGKKTYSINLRNTNPDIFVYDNVLISKTGFTSAAGRCVLMLVEKDKMLYAVVVLGQPTPKVRSQVVAPLISQL
jgi:D-alanyl-D-alanine endopeptidase (penicillin-binding protein 7)